METKIVVKLDNISKKFTMGEYYDSLRDLIPALTSKLLRNRKEEQLSNNEFWALRDVSFQVMKGEAFGIIGRNGAGKSTLLKLLCGIMKPNVGRIHVDGTLSALIEVGAGFHPDLTGRENIFLNGAIMGMKRNEIREKFDEIVDFSGLEGFIDTPVKRYSSGMYARLGFSVAAHVDPDILLVDEVLSVGDYQFQKKCIDKMHSILSNGTTIIFISHNLKAVGDLCSKTMLLDKGKSITVGETNSVIKRYMDQAISTLREKTQDVFIQKVILNGENGESLRFKTGSNVRVDVNIIARKRMENLGVTIELKDENSNILFGTSTYRLVDGTFKMNGEKEMTCTFEMELHLAPGIFHFGVGLYEYSEKKFYDFIANAASIVVFDEKNVVSFGSSNLYPKLRSSLPVDSWTYIK